MSNGIALRTNSCQLACAALLLLTAALAVVVYVTYRGKHEVAFREAERQFVTSRPSGIRSMQSDDWILFGLECGISRADVQAALPEYTRAEGPFEVEGKPSIRRYWYTLEYGPPFKPHESEPPHHLISEVFFVDYDTNDLVINIERNFFSKKKYGASVHQLDGSGSKLIKIYP